MFKEINPPKTYHENAETLLVGWGSSQGAVKESIDCLRSKGIDIGCVIFTDLRPFPGEASHKILNSAKCFFMVEQNSTAQLGSLIREQIGLAYSESVLKYDGRPFFHQEIVKGIEKLA